MDPMSALLDAVIAAKERGDTAAIDKIKALMADPRRAAEVVGQAQQLADLEDTSAPAGGTFR